MSPLWQRMQRLIVELLRRDDLSSEERFNALLLAMDAAELPRTEAQVSRMRKYWDEAINARLAHHRSF